MCHMLCPWNGGNTQSCGNRSQMQVLSLRNEHTLIRGRTHLVSQCWSFQVVKKSWFDDKNRSCTCRRSILDCTVLSTIISIRQCKHHVRFVMLRLVCHIYVGVAFWNPGALKCCLNAFWNVEKFKQKMSHVRLDILYVHRVVSRKTNILCVVCKKR